MGGCLRNVFALVGCLAVLLAGSIVVWRSRGIVSHAYRALTDAPGGTDTAAPTARAVGAPSPRAYASAEAKEAARARADGPGYVVITAEELASLIERRLDPLARRALDSVRVTLDRDRLVLEAQVLVAFLRRELPRELRTWLDARQPIRLAGSVALRRPGVVAWRCDEFVLGAVPLPAPVIPRLVDRLTGSDAGAVLIPIPPTVAEIRVRPDGVVFYREVT